jgi:opacity protein-like surface antigen
LQLPGAVVIWYGPAEGETTMTKTHFSNLILAAVFSTAMAAPAIASASASAPVNSGSSARSAHGTLIAGVAGSDDKKDDKKSEKKDKADKGGGKKDKAPAPTGGGW